MLLIIFIDFPPENRAWSFGLMSYNDPSNKYYTMCFIMYVLCSQMWWSSNLFLIATKFGSKILSGFQMLRFQLATTDSNITGPGVRHGCKTPISSSRWNRSHQLLGRWVWLIPMPCNTISINMTSTMYVIVKSGGLQRSFAVCLDFVGFRKDQMWFYIYYICNYLFVCLFATICFVHF